MLEKYSMTAREDELRAVDRKPLADVPSDKDILRNEREI